MDINAIEKKLIQRIRPIFMKNGFIFKLQGIEGPYETPSDKENAYYDIVYEMKGNEGFPVFRHIGKPKYKNPLMGLIMGKNKRTVQGLLISMYAEPYVEKDAYIAEVQVEPISKSKQRIIFIVGYSSK